MKNKNYSLVLVLLLETDEKKIQKIIIKKIKEIDKNR